MAYVAPSTVTTLQTYTSAAHNIIVNDIIDHESRMGAYIAATTLATTFTTTSTSVVDVTGFSVTFTAVAGRQYKITAAVNLTNSGANQNRFYITKAASQLYEGFMPVVTSPIVGTASIFALDTPGAGSVTYKIQMDVAAGTGTMYGTSTRASIASRMMVEVLGA
jgi:hypothetical protein